MSFRPAAVVVDAVGAVQHPFDGDVDGVAELFGQRVHDRYDMSMSAEDEIVVEAGSDGDVVDRALEGLRSEAAKLRREIDENVATRKALGQEVSRMRAELAKVERVLRASQPRKAKSE